MQASLAHRAASGARVGTAARELAQGEGWSVKDVLCTSGPGDRPFEELHKRVAIAVVVAGSFGYRCPSGRGLMTPGSWLLGNAGERFECGHEHAAGDRCVAFHYAPDWFERLAADAGAPRGARRFRAPRVPPLREASALVARAAAGLAGAGLARWEELALEVAGAALRLAGDAPADRGAVPAAVAARITERVRAIERRPDAPWTLARLAGDAGQSPFHFLRMFRRVTGVTPHQFILRARLREAAARLRGGEAKIIEVALDAGFGDVSNFNRAFRAEFGVPPRTYGGWRRAG
ncbi:MAG TPA: AraC family transcriptional regulator [Gemmatimonadales bacterium]|nr:AraC family transcriptional regulator [Gemmatimonadales bacterium]